MMFRVSANCPLHNFLAYNASFTCAIYMIRYPYLRLLYICCNLAQFDWCKGKGNALEVGDSLYQTRF